MVISDISFTISTYDAIIADQLQHGFIEKCRNPIISTSVYYISHHAVKKDSVITPICIVTAVSSTLQNDLCSIILQFRVDNYSFATDIEKAFLLHPDDRDYTRFLWLSTNKNPRSDFVTYQFQTVLFGATSSPFILNAVLHHQYQTSVASGITQNLYVNNIISGCS